MDFRHPHTRSNGHPIADQLEARFPELGNFKAALEDPHQAELPEVHRSRRPLIELQAMVLRALSGPYARRGKLLVQRLEAPPPVQRPRGTPHVFVNYRALDHPLAAAVIHERLVRRFGAENVFRDCVTLRPGEHYPSVIRHALENAIILVAVIGPRWLTLTDETGPLHSGQNARSGAGLRAELSVDHAKVAPGWPVDLSLGWDGPAAGLRRDPGPARHVEPGSAVAAVRDRRPWLGAPGAGPGRAQQSVGRGLPPITVGAQRGAGCLQLVELFGEVADRDVLLGFSCGRGCGLRVGERGEPVGEVVAGTWGQVVAVDLGLAG